MDCTAVYQKKKTYGEVLNYYSISMSFLVFFPFFETRAAECIIEKCT